MLVVADDHAKASTITELQHHQGVSPITNCWQKPSERRQLESDIRDELDFCGIDAIQQYAARLTSEFISLAENRENEIRNL